MPTKATMAFLPPTLAVDVYKRQADGYTITPCERDTVGTDVIMHIKADTDEESYSQYVEQNHIAAIVKKYSDYIRYPIRMLMNRSRMKERPADAGEDYTPEWEEYTAWETLNSMVPLWQRNKKDVKQEEYDCLLYTSRCV